MTFRPSLHAEGTMRNVVLEAFRECRQAPDDPFEESRFLTYLTTENSAKALERGEGHRRLYQFYDSIEDRLQIFVGSKKKRNWSIEEFCRYLERALESRSSTLRSAEHSNRRSLEGALIMNVILAPILFITFMVLGFLIGGELAGALVVMTWMGIMWHFFIKDYLRYRRIIRSNRG